MSTMDHVRYLATVIGPRGSTTPQEAEAARYAAQALRHAGVDPVIETFASARSTYYPYALFAGLMLASEVLFLLWGQWGAIAALTVTAGSLVSVLLELSFRPNPLRWLLPQGQSQNVWARLRSASETREQVVLLGHLDSHRTPLVFSSDRWLKVFGTLVPVGLLSSVLLLFLFSIGAFTPGWAWRYLSFAPAVFILGLLLISLQADSTPYNRGANDNATGAGTVLSIAEQLAREPLAHTTVWAVLTGCEEVGCYGADAFVRAHRHELGCAVWIPIEMTGLKGASPCCVTRETFLLTAHSDPRLIALADCVAARNPGLDAHSRPFQGAYSEGSTGAKYGMRVLGLTSASHQGQRADVVWHRTTDVLENVDAAVVAQSERFLWELLQEIDLHTTQDG